MKAKAKISGMIHSSFKPDKCKTALKMAVARIKLLKNKRVVLVKQMRRDLAQLLEAGQDQTARIRVEHVIREEKTMAAYDLIEVYCELIVARMAIIDSQKNCPIDLKEAISSVVFASPRCADIPELLDVRKHFVAKYGKEFTTAALEVRPDSGVSRLVVEKLSAKAPDIDTKVKILTEIAKEHNVNWDPKAFEEQVQKPKDDLLDGPNTFSAAAGKMTMDSSTLKPSSAQSWNNEPPTNASENFVAYKHPQPTFNVQTSSNLSPSKVSESKSIAEEVKYAYTEEKKTSFGRTDWNMEFKDAASAAKAAAESAEMASMAARAAAQLASHGNASVQNSSGSYEAVYATEVEQSRLLKSSRPENNTRVVGEVKYAEDYNRKGPQHMKMDIPNNQSEDAVQFSRRVDKSTGEVHPKNGNLTPKRLEENSRRLDKSPSDIHAKSGNLTPKRSYKDDFLTDSDESVDFLHEDDESHNSGHPSFSDAEPVSKDFDHYENQTASSKQKYDEASSSFQTATFDDYTIWDDHESTKNVEDSIDVNFDHYESDTDGHLILQNYGKEDLFTPTLSKQTGEDSGFPFNRETLSDEQHGRGHRSGLFSATETITEVNTKLDDNMPPSFDSDSLKSDSDGEINTLKNDKGTRAGNLLHRDSSSTSLSLPRSGNGTKFMNDKEGEESLNFPQIDDENLEEESSPSMKNWRKSGYSVGSKQQSPRTSSLKSFYDSEEGLGEDESFAASESDISGTLNIGRLTGGLRNKGYRGPKVQSSIFVSSLEPKRGVDETSVSQKVPDVSEHSAIPEVSFINEHDKDLSATSSNSRFSRAVGESFDDTESQYSHYRVDSRGSSFKALQKVARAREEKSAAVGKKFTRQYNDDILNPVQESYDHHQLQKEQRRSHLSSSLAKFDAEDLEERNYEDKNEDLEDNSPVRQREDRNVLSTEKLKFSHPHKMLTSETQDESSEAKWHAESRMPVRYADSDYKGEEESVAKRADKELKLSRRTRRNPVDSKKDIGTGNSNQSIKSSRPSSIIDTSVKISRDPGNLESKVIPKSRDPYSYTQELPAEQFNDFSLSVKETKRSSKAEPIKSTLQEKDGDRKTEGSSTKQISRENSLQGSHVHPKLPDYETLAAHFHSLRSNVRPK